MEIVCISPITNPAKVEVLLVSDTILIREAAKTARR
jgi:hypothetical protein